MGEMLILSELNSNLSCYKWQVQQSFAKGLSFWRDFLFKYIFLNEDLRIKKLTLMKMSLSAHFVLLSERVKQHQTMGGDSRSEILLVQLLPHCGSCWRLHLTLWQTRAYIGTLISDLAVPQHCCCDDVVIFLQGLKEWHLFLILHTTTIKKMK